MCGISGFVGEQFDDVIRLMTDSQKHRGPDDYGYFVDAESRLALGHRRLTIVDSNHGAQPFTNDEQDVVLVYNGEIFNSPELRRELEAKGHRFRTDHSDTEVVFKMYIEYGPSMVDRLNGMFAFVFYHRRERRLFGARDPFGIKPLFYHSVGSRFAFASEIKALLKIPGVEKTISNEALWHYLSFQCIPAPLSIFKNILKLPASHYFQYDVSSGRMTIDRYWKPRFGCDLYSQPELQEQIRTKVEHAVKSWSMSDFEIGCSLSGGLDSSIVTTLATQNQRRLKTYTVGFDGFSDLDERALAKKVSDSCGTEHTEIIITASDVVLELPRMIEALDEPYGGGIPSWFVYKRISRDLKVCLTGTGGDEIFGNYGKWKRYQSFRDNLYTFRKNHQRISVVDFALHPHGAFYYRFFTEKEKQRILNVDGETSSASLIEKLWKDSNTSNVKDSVLAVDTQLQLPEEFLMMTDRFSMNFSLEARTPFLDKELVTFVLSLAPELRSSSSDPKCLLRQAFNKILPSEIVNASKKGFVIPLSTWINDFLRSGANELLSRKFLQTQGIFNYETVDDLMRSRQIPFANEKIWTVLMFQFWYTRHFK